MRKVILYIAASIDGKIARKDDSIDWLPDVAEEDYGYKDFYDSIDTILMGYKTYEICLKLGEWGYNGKNSYVFSRNSDRNMIKEATLITKDPREFVNNLKTSNGGNIWLLGGGEIVTILHDTDLIDEYIIAFIPTILGDGIELFPNIKKERNLKLSKSKVYDNGVIMTYYQKG